MFNLIKHGKSITDRYNFFTSDEKDDFSFQVDSRFDVDWSIEPKESMEELCYRRAQQLRDQYDYLILYYSGGADSKTILETFLKYNIPLDEVVVSRYVDIDDPRINLPVENESFGFAKLTLVDVNYNALMNIFKKEKWDEYDQNFVGLLHTFNRYRIDFYEKFDLVEKQTRKGEVAHIFGGFYPHIICEFEGDIIHYTSVLNMRSAFQVDGDLRNVQFFTSPDMPELHIKQSHLLAKYLLKKHDLQRFEEFAGRVYDQKWITEDPIEKAIIRPSKASIGFFSKSLQNPMALNTSNSEAGLIFSKYFSDKKIIDTYKQTVVSPILLKEFNEIESLKLYYKYYRLFHVSKK